MERTYGLRNNTTILISTLSSKINLISHLSVAVIKEVLSDFRSDISLIWPKAFSCKFYQPRHKIHTTAPDKTCLGCPWPSN